MEDKHNAPSDNRSNLSNEEDMVNRYLAAALKQEIAKLREHKQDRYLPNSRSEGSLIPDYLTGFKIPFTAGPSGSSGSGTQASSQSSLNNALVNLNFNQHEGSTTTQGSNKDDSDDGQMETEETPSETSPNPFTGDTSKDAKVDVSNLSLHSGNSDEKFYDSLEASLIDSQTSHHKIVDSIRKKLIKKGKPITSVASDSNLSVTSPFRPRRSGRLLSKTANLGVKVPSSKGKPTKKPSIKSTQVNQLNQIKKLFTLGDQGLTQFMDSNLADLPELGKSTKRPPDSSPGPAQPRKQYKTEAQPIKQWNNQGLPQRENRSARRSRPTDADQLDAFSHAPVTPTGINANVNKQTHVATPRGVLQRADLEGSQVAGPNRSPGGNNLSPPRDQSIPLDSPWPSAHNIEEFVSNLTPIPPSGRGRDGLQLSDVLNVNLDPILAGTLAGTTKDKSDSSLLSSTKSSDVSIDISTLYPPRKVRDDIISALGKNKSTSKVKPKSSNADNNASTADDPIAKLMSLCDNAKFTPNSREPEISNFPPPTNNTDNVGFNLAATNTGTLPPLTNWASYLETIDSNPFSPQTSNSAASTSKTKQLTVNVANNKRTVTNSTNVTNKSNPLQEPPNEPIFDDAKSIWQQLRNALCRDVILRLRLRNIETMMSEGLVPKWSVSYMPPSGLITNENQVKHVIEVRKRIFHTQLECTAFLTKREIDSLKLKIDDLKRSLFALYQTPAGKKHDFDAALNSAIIQADKQRRLTFEELNKRLIAIRQAPEEALWQQIPEEFPRPPNAVRPAPVEPEPQPGPSNQGAPSNVPRSRSTQRWGQEPAGPRPRSKSNSNAPTAKGNNQGGQKSGWVKVVNKKSKKGKGQGKRSNNNAPYQRNNQRQEPPSPENELYYMLADFFRRHPNIKPNNNKKNNNQ